MAKPPVGVVFDADMGRIGDVLALALLFGLEQKGEARVVGLSTSRPSLEAAALMDALSKFYFGRPLPVGMPDSAANSPSVPALSAVASKFRHTVKTLNDTADPAATIRNAFTAQHDGNCIMLVSGPAANLVRAFSLPNVKDLAAAKTRFLMVIDDERFRSDPASARKILAEWPGSVLVCPDTAGAQIPFPQDSIDNDFAWAAEGHPVVAAYTAFRDVPYDAPAAGLAAVLHSVRAARKYFTLSEPGVISLDGELKFTPAPGGKHQLLIPDASRKEEIQKVYRELISVKPVSRFPRRT